jgi:hypothetical protein
MARQSTENRGAMVLRRFARLRPAHGQKGQMMEVTSKYYTPWAPDSPPDWKQQNKGITPIFFIETVPLYEADGKTPRIAADGKPLTMEMEFVRILIAGDGLCEASAPVDAAIKVLRNNTRPGKRTARLTTGTV